MVPKHFVKKTNTTTISVPIFQYTTTTKLLEMDPQNIKDHDKQRREWELRRNCSHLTSLCMATGQRVVLPLQYGGVFV